MTAVNSRDPFLDGPSTHYFTLLHQKGLFDSRIYYLILDFKGKKRPPKTTTRTVHLQVDDRYKLPAGRVPTQLYYIILYYAILYQVLL